MATFRFTKHAINDLSQIWDYTLETWSEKQAEKYYRLIMNTCAKIAEKPQTGKDYNEIYPELKGKLTSMHIIFYREMDDKSVEITRILHKRMDIKNKWMK